MAITDMGGPTTRIVLKTTFISADDRAWSSIDQIQAWWYQTEAGQWAKDQKIDVTAIWNMNHSTNEYQIALIGQMTEPQHVEYILRWGSKSEWL